MTRCCWSWCLWGSVVLTGGQGALACTSSGSATGSATTPTGAGGGAPSETMTTEVEATTPTISTGTSGAPGVSVPVPAVSGSALPPGDGALLGRDAVEMFLDHGGRQIYALHSFGDWLYFNGSVGGPHTFRVRKGTEPLLVRGAGPWSWLEELGPWSGSVNPKVFHSDATHIYWLDQTAIYRQGLDGVVDSVALDADPYTYQVLDGDADTVFAATDSCIRVALMDKATLSLRVFEPEALIPLGGNVEVVSDGARVYCAGMRSLLAPGFVPQTSADTVQAIHSVDKASGVLTLADINGGDMPPDITGMLYDDGAIFAASGTNGEFGTLDAASGLFSPLVQGLVSHASVLHRDSSTGFFYWADGFMVARFDPVARVGVPVVESIPASTWSGIAADDTHLYWVQTAITVRATGEKLVAGIVRIRKPE